MAQQPTKATVTPADLETAASVLRGLGYGLQLLAQAMTEVARDAKPPAAAACPAAAPQPAPQACPAPEPAACPAPAPAAAPAAADEQPGPIAQEVDDEFADLIGQGEPDHPTAPGDHIPLSAADITTAKALIKGLQPDQRQAFTAAYRKHFNIPSDVKQVGATVQQMQHLRFIQTFVGELELQGNG